jgi:hypothetical protein
MKKFQGKILGNAELKPCSFRVTQVKVVPSWTSAFPEANFPPYGKDIG